MNMWLGYNHHDQTITSRLCNKHLIKLLFLDIKMKCYYNNNNDEVSICRLIGPLTKLF